MLPRNAEGKHTHNVIPHGQVHRPNAPAGPYQHQPFPTVRYGPGGATTTVNDAEELAALGAEWREFPYPAKAAGTVAIVGSGGTSLTERYEQLQSAHSNLEQSHDALANDKAALQTQLEDLSGQLRLAEVAFGSLQKQHNMVKGQLTAARKGAPDPESQIAKDFDALKAENAELQSRLIQSEAALKAKLAESADPKANLAAAAQKPAEPPKE